MELRHGFLVLALFAVSVIPAGAVLAAGVVSLNFYQKDGACDVEGSFDAAADSPTAWAVLTDYDQMHQFVGSLKRSHLEAYSGRDHFLVEQEFEGGFLFVTKRVRVRLDIHETRYQSILFEDLGHEDFEVYKGSWTLKTGPDGEVRVTYALKAKQNFNEPFTGNYLKGAIQDLLDSVQKEILRRQALKTDPFSK